MDDTGVGVIISMSHGEAETEVNWVWGLYYSIANRW